MGDWKMRPPNKFYPLALHHLYIGIALMWLGIMAIFQPWSYTLGLWCIGIGIYCMIDDTMEHLITKDTPLRILFEKIIYPLFKKR